VLRTSLASVYNLWHLTHTNDHGKSNYIPQNAPFNSHYIPQPTKLWRNSCPAGVIFTEMQIPCSEQISRTWRNSIGLCLRVRLLPLTTEEKIIIETHFMWLHTVRVRDSDVLLLLLLLFSSNYSSSSSSSSSSCSSSSSSSSIIFPIRVVDYFFLPKGVSQPSTEWVQRNVPEGKAAGVWRLPPICI
jgi:hypothetical protein